MGEINKRRPSFYSRAQKGSFGVEDQRPAAKVWRPKLRPPSNQPEAKESIMPSPEARDTVSTVTATVTVPADSEHDGGNRARPLGTASRAPPEPLEGIHNADYPATPSTASRASKNGDRQQNEHSNAVQLLRDESMKAHFCKVLNITEAAHFSKTKLARIFDGITEEAEFRWFAGRSIVDFKVEGRRHLQMPSGFRLLQPLVNAMVAIAKRSLEDDEELAIIQLIINFFKHGGDEVKPHMHRCRQICLALGAERELDVEGLRFIMGDGDMMLLDRHTHSVPPSPHVDTPRISICLFYGSAEEYESKSISVNANDGWHGDSFWWNHPQDIHSAGYKRSSGKKGGGKALGRGVAPGPRPTPARSDEYHGNSFYGETWRPRRKGGR